MENLIAHCKGGRACSGCREHTCPLYDVDEPKPGEECGVFGMYDLDGNNVAPSIYYGLFALQHRGQESCGIAVSRTDGPPRNVNTCKGMGLVNKAFRRCRGILVSGMSVIRQQGPVQKLTRSRWY